MHVVQSSREKVSLLLTPRTPIRKTRTIFGLPGHTMTRLQRNFRRIKLFFFKIASSSLTMGICERAKLPRMS